MKLLNILWLTCLCFFLTGCIPQKTSKLSIRKPAPAPIKETVSSSVLRAEVPGSLLTTIHGLLGPSNTITIMKPLVLQGTGAVISVPALCPVSYITSPSSASFTFTDPKPTIAYGLLHPILETILIVSDTEAEVTVNELGLRLKKRLTFSLSDLSGSALEVAPVPSKPIVWGWSTTGCPPCASAHNDLSDPSLPFEVVWNPKDIPNPYTSYPSFAWSTDNVPNKNMKQNWKQNGWPGKDKFVKTWQDSRTPRKASVATGWHQHQCPKCSNIWSHPDNSPSASHRCSRCGTYQYEQL